MYSKRDRELLEFLYLGTGPEGIGGAPPSFDHWRTRGFESRNDITNLLNRQRIAKKRDRIKQLKFHRSRVNLPSDLDHKFPGGYYAMALRNYLEENTDDHDERFKRDAMHYGDLWEERQQLSASDALEEYNTEMGLSEAQDEAFDSWREENYAEQDWIRNQDWFKELDNNWITKNADEQARALKDIEAYENFDSLPENKLSPVRTFTKGNTQYFTNFTNMEPEIMPYAPTATIKNMSGGNTKFYTNLESPKWKDLLPGAMRYVPPAVPKP